jgi:hypothetical protein
MVIGEIMRMSASNNLSSSTTYEIKDKKEHKEKENEHI